MSNLNPNTNEVLNKLPKHLLQYVIDQQYEHYSPIDQAIWRYVMHKNTNHLPKIAHASYLDGLAKAGISAEEIPSMYGMNRILKNIGWAAVAVDGYIPAAAFMEFQAFNVLVITHEIRKMEHLEYTPAPDIIHEAAGHAPIIANPEYAEYLRRLGQIGCKAISSPADYQLFEGIRKLSILKESKFATPKQVEEAEENLLFIQQNMTDDSEMNQIKNMHWWTVEYGLIGNLENHKIYGAGLLSSIGESESCLKSNVEKKWYSVDAAFQNFDITKPQPQLYVTPDFAHLSFVLEQFANQMALRKGGTKGIQKLISSQQLGTIEYNTGIQVSGKFTDLWIDEYQNPIYFKTTGPTALAFQQKELIGHGTNYHQHGFGSPIGKLKNSNTPIERMSPYDLQAYKIREGEKTKLEFESGVCVEGEVITGKRSLQGTILLVSFKNCRVTYFDEVLFEPTWGIYDMAVGTTIFSAFAGPADSDSFDLLTHQVNAPAFDVDKNDAQTQLEAYYAEIREMRESDTLNKERINKISKIIAAEYPNDWLLQHEINELM